METLQTVEQKINISKEMKSLQVSETLDLPLNRRYYASILASKLKFEIGKEYITRRVGDKVVVTRIK